MRLEEISEYGLVQRIIQQFGTTGDGIVVGIGDDAAVLSLDPARELVATCDMLLEGAHFDLRWITPRQLGWKALAVNLSDIAAMGAEPRFSLVSLGLPPQTEVNFFEEFFQGFRTLGDRFRTLLCGGDIVSSPLGLVVNVTVLGQIEKPNVLTRSGAKPGDLLAVTGYPGSSAAGLALLMNNCLGKLPADVEGELLRAHLEPYPRVQEGRFLALERVASALNDVSDGLAREVREIAEASGVGAVIYAEKLPLSGAVKIAGAYLNRDPVFWALDGGEDYELVFTLAPENLVKLEELRKMGTPVAVIGEITDARNALYLELSGERINLEHFGYDHFRKKS
ncbi:MAG: thiamine-phosphate kinase [Firmicutes bacterium]|nr:thiamine-phosphate kinase [Bacillota bacterium]